MQGQPQVCEEPTLWCIVVATIILNQISTILMWIVNEESLLYYANLWCLPQVVKY